MPKILHAFLGGHHVGVFEWLAEATGAEDPRVGFRYDTDYRGAPLSLSLPLDGTWHEEAPFNWLDNLLPESDEARERLAHVCGVASDTHGLLSALGEDMAGAASLSLDANLPDREPAPLLLASLWPEYDQRVSMHIDGAFHPGQINAHRWASFARTNALDEARLLDEVRHIYRHVAERLPDALAAADLPAVQVDRASAFVREKILPTGLAT